MPKIEEVKRLLKPYAPDGVVMNCFGQEELDLWVKKKNLLETLVECIRIEEVDRARMREMGATDMPEPIKNPRQVARWLMDGTYVAP